MKPKDYAKQIALYTCVYYTAVTFLLLFLFFLLNADLQDGFQVIKLIFILPFSLCFSVANTLYRHTKLDKWLRLVIHYILTVGGAYGFLYFPNKDPQQSSSAALTLFFVFTAVYVIIMGAVLLVHARIHRVKRDEAKYTSVYKK